MGLLATTGLIMALLETYPSVYVVNGEYQICALVTAETTMWVEVDGRNYYDHSNGILRSGKYLHIAHVPQQKLDSARKYKVFVQRLNERKPYFTDYGEVESAEFEFQPVTEKSEYHIVNLADAHNLVDAPIAAGSYFGDKLDLLVMNGDIPNHSGDVNYFKGIYQISGAITKGRVPCVFSRGNHDMRGIYAEQLADYTPTEYGRSYYTFAVGPIWGIVLDSGEDKIDTCQEYGRTVCCAAFREEEEEFIDKVIAKGEYKDYNLKLIISHNPFNHKIKPPFDIEQERYARWCSKLKAVKPTLMLSGHLHECYQEEPGGKHDDYGQPCTMICSSRVNAKKDWYQCGAVTLTADGKASVVFNENKPFPPDEE